MKNVNEYRSHFEKVLSARLEDFENQRKAIIIKVIISKFFGVIVIMMFVSLFIGFLNAFPFDDFGSKIILIFFQGFFYLIIGIIVIMLAYRAIKYVLYVKGASEILKNKQKIYVFAITAGLSILICGSLVGRFYMGDKIFSIGFFFRYFLGIVTIIAFGILANIFSRYEKRFNQAIKSEILPKILQFIDPEIKYEPKGFIKQFDFVESCIYPNRQIHQYKGSDFVTGTYGHGSFAFSELDVMEITRSRSAGKTETKISQLFKGLFYVADFNKSFAAKTIIYPDYARSLLGEQFGEMLNQAFGQNNTQLVKLEEAEFEKEFAVYSTSQVEARYILTPSMIERIKEIKQKLQKDIYISFINKRVYIGIPGDTEFLVPVIFHNLLKFETIEPIYYGIDALLDIPKDLHLNTRIWGDV
jgi:hypothetical protein